MKSLHMFDAAARHLNFQRAADELNLTQGAVAQQVRRLEADLGQPLFVRQARGLALTEVGQEYHRSIRRALRIIDEATAKLAPSTTKLALSVTPSFASKWLVTRLAAFEREYPEIDLQVHASEGLSNFSGDGVDLAIRQGHIQSDSNSNASLLCEIRLCAVCSPAVARQLGAVRELSDFGQVKLIQDAHKYWQRLFETQDIELPARVLQFNQTALSIDAAANGQGVALAPQLLVHDEIEAGRLLSLQSFPLSEGYGYYFVSPRVSTQSPAQDAVVTWLQNRVEQLKLRG